MCTTVHPNNRLYVHQYSRTISILMEVLVWKAFPARISANLRAGSTMEGPVFHLHGGAARLRGVGPCWPLEAPIDLETPEEGLTVPMQSEALRLMLEAISAMREAGYTQEDVQELAGEA